jgi:hypothetical protein
MKTRTLEQSIDRIRARLARKYPGLEFEIETTSPREATIYFYERDSEDWYDVIHSVSGLAVDTLVDYDHWIHVQPKFRQPAAP